MLWAAMTPTASPGSARVFLGAGIHEEMMGKCWENGNDLDFFRGQLRENAVEDGADLEIEWENV